MRASASGLRLGKRAGAAILTGLLLWAPPPASADDDDWGGRGHHGRRHGYRGGDAGHHHARRHEHGNWCPPHHDDGPRYYPRPYAGWGPGWYGPPVVAHARYRCEPCGRWYDEEAAFHYHVHRHHNIAQAVIPLVIGAAAFGWIFYGY